MKNADERFYCPLQPCTPGDVSRPDAYGSLSFATRDGYLRHIENGHFIPRSAAPLPFMTAEAAMRRYMEEGR